MVLLHSERPLGSIRKEKGIFFPDPGFYLIAIWHKLLKEVKPQTFLLHFNLPLTFTLTPILLFSAYFIKQENVNRFTPYMVQHRSKNIIFWAGQAAHKVDFPRQHFYLPRHCKIKVRLDLALNITCRAGQVRVLFSLPNCRFLPNSLALACKGAGGYVARCPR